MKILREFYFADCRFFVVWGTNFCGFRWVVSKTKTEARSTQISKMKHPKLENGAPKTRKRTTQNSKTKHPNFESTERWRTRTLSLAWRRPNQVEAMKRPHLQRSTNPSHGAFDFLPAEVGQYWYLLVEPIFPATLFSM